MLAVPRTAYCLVLFIMLIVGTAVPDKNVYSAWRLSSVFISAGKDGIIGVYSFIIYLNQVLKISRPGKHFISYSS